MVGTPTYSTDSDFISDDGGDAPSIVSRDQTSASPLDGDNSNFDSNACLKGSVKRQRKNRQRSTEPFRDLLLSKYGLQVVDGGKNIKMRPQSKCTQCNVVHINIRDWWIRHASTCTSTNKQVEVLRRALTAGGTAHIRRNCDMFVIVYWIYKNKVPFTHGSKIKEVRSFLLVCFPYQVAYFHTLHLTTSFSYCNHSIVWINKLQQLYHCHAARWQGNTFIHIHVLSGSHRHKNLCYRHGLTLLNEMKKLTTTLIARAIW